MPRTLPFVLALLLIALVCLAGVAAAQSSVGPSTGGVVITLSPENGEAVPASPAHVSPRADFFEVVRQWFASFAAPVLPATGRLSSKAHRTAIRRSPVWVP